MGEAAQIEKDKSDFWHGKLGRSGFIWRSLLCFLIVLVVDPYFSYLADAVENGIISRDSGLYLISVIVFFTKTIIIFIYSVSLCLRRLNDIRANRRLAFFLIFPGVCLILWVWLACAKTVNDESNGVPQ